MHFRVKLLKPLQNDVNLKSPFAMQKLNAGQKSWAIILLKHAQNSIFLLLLLVHHKSTHTGKWRENKQTSKFQFCSIKE